MHAFDHRLNQLLDRVANLTPGRRQRLTRSLRQDDVELGVRAADASLDAAMKAALRVAAHEVLDTFCTHLEGALARCRSDEARTLLLAIVSIALAEHACVLFENDGQVSGVEFAATETFVLSASPRADVDLQLTLRGDRQSAQRRPKDQSKNIQDRSLLIAISLATRDNSPDDVEKPAPRAVISPADVADDPFHCAAGLLQRLRPSSTTRL